MTDLLDLSERTAVPVLTALHGPAEPLVVEALEADARTSVVRRCADVAELLSLAEAGRGAVAVVSGGFHRVDADVIARLRRCGLRVVGVVDPDRDSRRRVRALGVDRAVPLSPGDGPTRAAEVVAAVLGDRAAATPPLDGHPEPTAGPPPDRDTDDAPRGVSVGYSLPDGSSPPSGAADAARVAAADPATDAVADLAPSFFEDLDTARAEDIRGRVVTVWGAPGSPGRTTVAVTLAAELAALGEEVLLVDADTHAASVASHLGVLDEAAGVVVAARAGVEGRLGPAVLDRTAPVALPRVRLLTGITRSARWPELRPAGFEAVLRAARRAADVVVVDVGAPLDRDEDTVVDVSAPRRNAATLMAVDECDVLLAVGAADPVGLQRLVRSLQELDAAGLPGAPAPTVVVNKVRASAVGPDPARRVRQALERFAGVADPVLLPWDPAGADAALLAGRTLGEASPSSPLRLALGGLAASLAGRPAATARRRRWGPGRRSVTA
jgi:MinD-like ATPase involved in chromosome partitioning or flagellar assembly